ncbi:hypothetical protein Pgy4_31731 [Pseudomonas savastanoi pv. glycinea str. race 4]|uniref:Uncharacterized protein n=1 Tax=Pseudomonas savastanoi pv. glycinea str. race 4 TaxID=875330 RepID=F3CE44_PSESG|nr:hypothetical protein Pgy4_31731 [Pseudomonas savastanoi pv. glycinea str. race 4]
MRINELNVRLREQARSLRFAVVGVTGRRSALLTKGSIQPLKIRGAESLLHLHFRVAVFKHPNHFGGVPRSGGDAI